MSSALPRILSTVISDKLAYSVTNFLKEKKSLHLRSRPTTQGIILNDYLSQLLESELASIY